jgi:hypothetical protein
VFDDRRDLVALVAPGVQHRHVETAIEESAHDVRSGRTGTADHERA